jgi:hypothetical protein
MGTAGPVDADADMPRPVSTVMMAASVSSGNCDSWVTTLQAAVKWLSRPQGEPSGVWTGHRKPQDSGSNLRTVVVRNSAK